MPDYLDVDIKRARGLMTLAGFDLPLSRVRSTGTAHTMFRLGHELVLRLPRRSRSVTDVERELQVLDRMQPALSVETPRPVHLGAPTAEYPSAWSVVSWIDGEVAQAPANDLVADVAALLAELRAVGPAGGPAPSNASYGRGVSLRERDELTRKALHASTELVDIMPLLAVWADEHRPTKVRLVGCTVTSRRATSSSAMATSLA